MAVSRHLGFYRTTNSAIQSTDPENPSLKPNLEWIGWTVCEIFAFTVTLKVGFGVTQGHRKMALFDRAHTTLYSSSIVTMPLSSTISEIKPHIGRKFLPPLYLAPPLGVKPSDLRNDPWWRKTRMMGLWYWIKIFHYDSAAWIWNHIPTAIKVSPSLDSFKRHLKTHYFTSP